MKINEFFFLFYVIVFIELFLSYCTVNCSKENITILASKNFVECKAGGVVTDAKISFLKKCDILNGNLFIALLNYSKNVSLSRLKEIRGSLVLYYVNNINSIGDLLPNLTVIRGETTVQHYSLIIKETDAKFIGLTELRYILKGGIKIQSNPSLCYTSTVKWRRILYEKNAKVHIVGNRKYCFEKCPKTCNNMGRIIQDKLFCWSQNDCQKLCDQKCTIQNLSCFLNDSTQCCHQNCLGGCTGTSDSDCVACRALSEGNRCVNRCSNGYVLLGSWKCVRNDDCISRPVVENDNNNNNNNNNNNDRIITIGYENQRYVIENGRCVVRCSQGRVRNETSGVCVDCAESCSRFNKNCGDVFIHSIRDLVLLDGCYSVKDLYIGIKDEIDGLDEQLTEAVKHLRIVKYSIKIIHCKSLKSLNFLKNVREIRGSHFTNNSKIDSGTKPMVLEVSSNDNLVNVWTEFELNKQLKLVNGYASFIVNRKLCPKHILNFLKNGVQSSYQLSSVDEKMINISNGDLAFCKYNKLLLTIDVVSDTKVNVTCSSRSSSNDFFSDENMSVLFMLKSTNEFLSYYELYDDICGDDGDWVVIEGFLNKVTVLETLTPATRYAIYAESLRSRSDSWLQISKIHYFTTKPRYPSPPVGLQTEVLDHSQILLSWKPPLNPNGLVTKYNIYYKELRLSPDDNLFEEICSQSAEIRENLNANIADNFANNKMATTCDCKECLKKCDKKYQAKREEDNEFHFQFQDFYLAHFYSKQYDISFTNRSRTESDDNRNVSQSQRVPVTKNLEKLKSEKVDIKEEKINLKAKINPSKTNKFIDAVTTDNDKIDSKNDTIKLTVPSSVNSYRFQGLHHYTEYKFLIEACQNFDHKARRGRWIYQRRVCSYLASITAYTYPKAEADNLNLSSIKVKVANKSALLEWAEPKNPNGMVIYFLVRYRKMTANSKFWQVKCISRKQWITCNNNSEIDTGGGAIFTGTAAAAATSYTDITATTLLAGSATYHQSKRSSNGSIKIDKLMPGKYEYQLKAFSLAGNGSWTESMYFVVEANPFINSFQFYLVLIGLFLLVLLVLFSWGLYYYYRRKRFMMAAFVSSNPNYWIIYDVDEWEINRNDVDMINWNYPLGRGSFGMVYKAALRQMDTPAKEHFYKENSSNSSASDMFVAVKTLNPNCTVLERREFINEACYMKQFSTCHLVRLIGVVTKIDLYHKPESYWRKFKNKMSDLNQWTKSRYLQKNEQKHAAIGNSMELSSSSRLIIQKSAVASHFQKMPLVIMELMENGDLNSYLRKKGEEGEGCLSDKQSILWSLQIADGMLYLSDLKFVHRDLAIRNCLINAQLIVKLGDFGMARDVYYDCYYRKKGGAPRLPVRWMAPEALESLYFTVASDIWAYGVVLWEISTLASLPYRSMSHSEVLQYVLIGGNPLTRDPDNKAPPILLDIMRKCWFRTPSDRIDFNSIVRMLVSFADDNFMKYSYYTAERNHQSNDKHSTTEESHPTQPLMQDYLLLKSIDHNV